MQRVVTILCLRPEIITGALVEGEGEEVSEGRILERD